MTDAATADLGCSGNVQLGSPLSYLFAASLGALQRDEPIALSLAATSVVWGASLPATLWLAARLDPPRTDRGDDLDGH